MRNHPAAFVLGACVAGGLWIVAARAESAAWPVPEQQIWRVSRLPREPRLPRPAGSVVQRAPSNRGGEVLRDVPFTPAQRPASDGVPVEQVIVTSDALAAAFETLAARETARGIPTVVRTTSWIDASYAGADAPARIRAFLRDAHDRWGTEWVVLGGDVEHVPTRYVPWSGLEIPTDLYYECLDREWNEDGDAVFAEPLTAANLVDFVNDVALGADGRVWVAMNVGLAVLEGGAFAHYTQADGLPSDEIHDVDVAPDGSVWAATAMGVAVFDGAGAWTAHTRASGLPGDDVLCIAASGAADVWAGTSAGLAHWDGSIWVSYSTADGLPSNTITALAQEGARLWVGSLQGVASYEGGAFTRHDAATSGLLSDHVISIAVDAAGSVWLGHLDSYFHAGGLSRFDGTAWSTDDLAAWGGLSIRALVFGPAPGELWAATPEGVLHRTPGGDELLDDTQGLAGADVQSIAPGAGGTMLVAGSDGLSIGTPGGWTVYTGADGLPGPPRVYDDPDLVPDVALGRIPATDLAEAQTYLAKLFAYERGEATDRVETTLLLGETMFSSSDGRDICLAAAQALPASFAVTGLYEVDGTENTATVLAELNRGYGIVLHVGHGSYDVLGIGPSEPDQGLLFNSQIDGVSSGGRAGLVLGYNCNSGGFDQDCSMEHLLFNPSGGAVATSANTRASMPQVDAEVNLVWLEKLFASAHASPALAFQEAREQVVADHLEEMQLATWWRRQYVARSFLGAPTLRVWRTAPHELAVAHPATLPAARVAVPVVVTDANGGAPVVDALVCLSKGNEDYAYGRTDASGTVTFDFRAETPGTLSVAVGAPDFRPYAGAAIVVAPVEPNLVAQSWQRVDAGASLTWQVQFALRNAGSAALSGWTLALSSADPRVTVVQAGGALPAIAAGGIAWTGAFEIQVAPAVSDGDELPLLLTGSGTSTFAETFRVTARTARLELEGLVILGGELYPRVVNRGTAATGAVTATLVAVDGLGTVIEGTAAAAPLATGESRVLADGFTVAGDPGAVFELTLDDGVGHVSRFAVDREPPLGAVAPRAEPREGGALASWSPSASADLAGYRVYGRAPGGHWVDEVGALVSGGSRVFVNIAAGSSRELLILAVDASGNSSVDSCFVTAYAAPPVLAGWPQRVSSVIGPSAMVATDLDGDGRSEILHGSLWDANAAHVFRADGSEWVDGDGSAATNGIFGRTGGRVVHAPLAVDVDGDGAKEIFAGSYDGMLYGWRTGGPAGAPPAPLPAFPVAVSVSALRSSPLAGDLDGDGALELVVVASYRNVHAFETDGTPLAGWPKVTGASGLHTTPAVADLDGDGRDDVVFGGNTDNVVYALSGDGSDLPGWPASVGAPVASSPVLVDVAGDADPEIFAIAKDGTVHGFDTGGNPLPGWPAVLARPVPAANASPAAADFDGDGRPEIVIGGDGEIVVLRGDGGAFPGSPIRIDAAAEASPVIADLDGDGSFEILLGTSDYRLHAFRLDGTDLPGWPFPFTELANAEPFVADVDADGRLDVVVGADDAWVRVLGLAARALPGAAPWPGYHGGARLDGVYRHIAYGLPGEPQPAAPTALRLERPWPNPFRHGAEVRLVLPAAAPARLDVLDVRGRRVAVLLQGGVLPAGSHVVAWDGRDARQAPVPSGVYFLRLESHGDVRTRKLLRLR